MALLIIATKEANGLRYEVVAQEVDPTVFEQTETFASPAYVRVTKIPEQKA